VVEKEYKLSTLQSLFTFAANVGASPTCEDSKLSDRFATGVSTDGTEERKPMMIRR